MDYLKSLFGWIRRLRGGSVDEKDFEELINVFRTTVPLTVVEVGQIESLLKKMLSDKEQISKEFRLIKMAMRSRQRKIAERKGESRHTSAARKSSSVPQTGETEPINSQSMRHIKDVSYVVNGNLVYGDIGSDEEHVYFNEQNVEILNSQPHQPKKCELPGCQACIEARLRREITRKVKLEEALNNEERIKKRRLENDGSVVSTLNEQLGCPLLIARSLADDRFSIDELGSDDREEFLRWKENNRRMAAQMNKEIFKRAEQGANIFSEGNASKQASGAAGGVLNVAADAQALSSTVAGTSYTIDDQGSESKEDNLAVFTKNSPMGTVQSTFSNPFAAITKSGPSFSTAGETGNLFVATATGAQESPFRCEIPKMEAPAMGTKAVPAASAPLGLEHNAPKLLSNSISNLIDENVKIVGEDASEPEAEIVTKDPQRTPLVSNPFSGSTATAGDSAAMFKNPFSAVTNNAGNGAFAAVEEKSFKAPVNPFSNITPLNASFAPFGGSITNTASTLSGPCASPFGGLAVGQTDKGIIAETVPVPSVPSFSKDDKAIATKGPFNGLSIGQDAISNTLSNPFGNTIVGSGDKSNLINTLMSRNPFASKASPGVDVSTGNTGSNSFGNPATVQDGSTPFSGLNNPFSGTGAGPQANPFATQQAAASSSLLSALPSAPVTAVANPFPNASAPGTEQINPFMNSNFSSNNPFQIAQSEDTTELAGGMFSNTDDAPSRFRRAKRRR